MGNIIADSMNENMKKNTEEMMNKQKEMQLQIREIQMATQFALGKDRFHFFSVFYFTVITGGIIKYLKTGSPTLLIPVVPLSFAWAYQFDLYYLNKMERVRKDAGNILKNNFEMFIPPENNKLISYEEYVKKFKK